MLLVKKCPATCSGANSQLTWQKNWVTTVPGKVSVCGCCAPAASLGYTKIRQQPINFTGEFVLHCHILGHEDRGMMQNVQVVCPTPNETSFGKPMDYLPYPAITRAPHFYFDHPYNSILIPCTIKVRRP
jgi:hypothetical protein